MLALKVASVVLIGLFILALAIQFLTSSFSGIRMGLPMGIGGGNTMVLSTPGYDGDYRASYGGAAYDKAEFQVYSEEGSAPMLSIRNAASTIYPPSPMSPSGADAEAFEVTNYSATIETKHLKESCDAFEKLKERDDVIFESANAYDRGCNFSFKVKHASVEGVLEWLRAMDPKDLSENSYTIKRQIDDFTSEVEILENKRASIDATLSKALSAYDEITALATRTQNAEALASIINSKISIIERLSQERININTELDRLSRAKEDQLDRLEYTYFNVNVYENKYIDGEQLKDSWKEALRMFVHDVNKIAQDLSINLVLLGLLIVQWLLYAFIVLVVVKYAWKVGKALWER